MKWITSPEIQQTKKFFIGLISKRHKHEIANRHISNYVDDIRWEIHIHHHAWVRIRNDKIVWSISKIAFILRRWALKSLYTFSTIWRIDLVRIYGTCRITHRNEIMRATYKLRPPTIDIDISYAANVNCCSILVIYHSVCSCLWDFDRIHFDVEI